MLNTILFYGGLAAILGVFGYLAFKPEKRERQQ
jgi:hypothetical protein